MAKSCPALVTPWIIACWAPLCMELSRQEYWSGLPFPSPGDLPQPGINPGSPALQADSYQLSHEGRRRGTKPLLDTERFGLTTNSSS